MMGARTIVHFHISSLVCVYSTSVFVVLVRACYIFVLFCFEYQLLHGC